MMSEGKLLNVQDYFVLIPQDYYEASVLQQRVTSPCELPGDPGPWVFKIAGCFIVNILFPFWKCFWIYILLLFIFLVVKHALAMAIVEHSENARYLLY